MRLTYLNDYEALCFLPETVTCWHSHSMYFLFVKQQIYLKVTITQCSELTQTLGTGVEPWVTQNTSNSLYGACCYWWSHKLLCLNVVPGCILKTFCNSLSRNNCWNCICTYTHMYSLQIGSLLKWAKHTLYWVAFLTLAFYNQPECL